ncbi:hypothetical protein [Archangium gephyra]|nr:hypothetical protein [Archangium gephyra]AKJ05076.1 Hypothetical protein AA314_06702 [Archangium gephyra]
MNAVQIEQLLKLDPSVYLHFTDSLGFHSIQQEGLIRTNTKGFVFLTRMPFSAEQATVNLFISASTHTGRGSHVFVLRLDPGLRIIPTSQNYEGYEYRATQSIKLKQNEVLYAGENPFRRR